MKILPILSLCAICALAGEFEIQPENNRIHFNVNADFSDKIGQITHESPINCTPKLSGAFEFVSAQEFNFYPQNGLAKGIKIKCDDMTIENEPFAITQFRAIDERSYEIIFNDLIGDIKPSFEVFQKVKMEYSKVEWPSRTEVIHSTIWVVTMTVIISIYLGVFDILAVRALNFLEALI